MGWTKEQQLAIDIEKNNVIVSAGAGSGKTAVLTQRVLRKVMNNTHINELLILTFTKAAASEMKERIRKALQKAELKEELDLIDSAYITTFDSFSLGVVKKYHNVVNKPKDIKITDPILIDIRKRELLDEVFDRYYKESSQEFQEFISHFCIKDDKELKDIFIKLLSKLDLRYDKHEFLDNYFNNFYSEEALENSVHEYLEYINHLRSNIRECIKSISEHLEGSSLEKIYTSTSKILNANVYEEIKSALLDIKLPRATKDYNEKAKSIKNEIKEIIKSLNELCTYQNVNGMKEELKFTYNDAKIFIDILKELEDRFDDIREKEGLYDFTDISNLAIKIVSENESIREELKNSFNEILIDEYQDTSDTQELFISYISNNNVYMVGDIKQSIYRFRNANPYIFKNKYDLYKNDSSKGIKIDLNKNFRSRKEVLDNINILFRNVMDDNIGGADYTHGHEMVYGNLTYENEGKTNQNYNMNIKLYEKSSEISNTEKEAFIIAKDIKNKIESKYQIFDKDKLELRAIKYSDFVILLDKKKNFDIYKKIFEYLQVPLTLSKEENLSNADDLFVIYHLIRLVLLVNQNEYSTNLKYSYTSIARSFLFNYDDSYIYETLVNKNFGDDPIINKAKLLKADLEILPLTILFKKILKTFDYEEKILTTNNIEAKEKRIEYLINLLNDLGDKGISIDDLLYYLEKVIDEGYDMKYTIHEDAKNSVQIMSIHKSKGLEFPICYFADLTNRFNDKDLKERIVLDNEFGLLIPNFQADQKQTIRTTLYRKKARYEEIGERIRLFYVSTTRCKEKMIFIAPLIDNEEEDIPNIVSNSIREKYNSFYSIIKSIWPNIKTYQEILEEKEDDYTRDYLYTNKISINLNEDEYQKYNVSNIKINEKDIKEEIYSSSNINILTTEEQEIFKLGTEIHKILEQIDFNNPQLDCYNIAPTIKKKINKFLTSDLIKNSLNRKVYKEYEFIEKEELKISHGVIDLMLESDTDIIIIDYKLKDIDGDKYKKQLLGYKKYIEKKTGKQVITYLYSILDEKFKEIK